jgi:hypothetical protein
MTASRFAPIQPRADGVFLAWKGETISATVVGYGLPEGTGGREGDAGVGAAGGVGGAVAGGAAAGAADSLGQ